MGTGDHGGRERPGAGSGEGGGHSHDHSQGHSHDHSHGHAHGHAHGDGHSHGHAHEPGAGAVPRIHRAAAPRQVRVAVITASDTRTEDDDTSGRYLAETVQAHGHPLAHRAIVPDEAGAIRGAIEAASAAGAEVVLVTGGTGISRRDVTVDVVEGLLERRLPGFGELFRMLSFQEIGSAAMLSRATAGATGTGLLIFALPGSTGACRTALERLILPEIGHLVREATRA